MKTTAFLSHGAKVRANFHFKIKLQTKSKFVKQLKHLLKYYSKYHKCGVNIFFIVSLIPLSKTCIYSSGTMQVTGCQPQNGLACDISPVNVLFTISLTATRVQSGALFRCEPQLDLGPEGPQSPLQFNTHPLNLTVYCKILFSFGSYGVRAVYRYYLKILNIKYKLFFLAI